MIKKMCYVRLGSAIYLLLLLSSVESIEPITTGIVGSIAAALMGGAVYKGFDVIKDNTYCLLNECCNDDYIPNNLEKLYKSLKTNVHGQHVVLETVVPAIQGHLLKTPKKPLTLSFHGTPGSGKNYVAQFVANSLYKKGEKSKFVHTYNGGLHFPLHYKVQEYKAKLIDEVRTAVSACERSLFIFDEVDKMPEGVLDGLKPMLDYHGQVSGIDYRKAIFIFLSNKGSREITFHLLDLWDRGLAREKTRLSHLEQLVIKGAFEEEGGFKHSSNIKSGLIDHYIPFFPLERRHVEMCAQDEFRKFEVFVPSEKAMEEVLSYITYGPDNKQIFAKSGCKRISQKVATIVTRDRMESERKS